MNRPNFHASAAPRRGIILLVVLVMLTLFATIGLTFAFFADSEANSSRTFRAAQDLSAPPDFDPEQAAALFFSQWLFDVDDQQGVYSAMRGHGLLRNMYGLNYTINPDGTITLQGNDVPFNGVGRLNNPINAKLPFIPSTISQWLNGQDGAFNTALVNYTYFPVDSFLRDPERVGLRQNPQSKRGDFFGGFNAPYTYPDLNNMFLAAVKADGTVLMPSFHRPWSFDFTSPPGPGSLWIKEIGKYKTLRPRPVDNLNQAQVRAAGLPWQLHPDDPTSFNAARLQQLQTLIKNLQDQGQLFPYPEDKFGDVKNLVGAPGGNDSIWMDLGAPVITLPDGRKAKMLFAPLIMDMDGRLNLNAHGNIRGVGLNHVSNMGLGLWEVSLVPVFGNTNREWINLFTGTQGKPGVAPVIGKYGVDQNPSLKGQKVPVGPAAPHFFGKVDYDGATGYPNPKAPNGGITDPMLYPWSPRPPPGAPPPLLAPPAPYSCFPNFSAGYGDNTPVSGENLEHPLYYSPFKSAVFDANNDDAVFNASNLAALLRYGDTGSEFLTSDLLALCPTSFAIPRIRGMVTTHSFDVNMPGASPWILDSSKNPFTFPNTALLPTGTPKGIPFPALPLTGPTPNGSEFAPDGRFARIIRTQPKTATTPAFTYDSAFRLDLNQTLPAYPTPDPKTGSLSNAAGSLINPAQFNAAQDARIDLAAHIYYCLVRATGAYDPYTYDPMSNPAKAAPTLDDINTLRWLAQIAANMVDFMDSDDYSTPFNWGMYGSPTFPGVTPTGGSAPNSTQWVFGTELPRVVLNEAYVQYVNNLNDPGLKAPPPIGLKPPNPQLRQATKFDVQVWVELHNPFNSDPTLPDSIQPPPAIAPEPTYHGAPTNPAPNRTYNTNGAARLQLPGPNGTPVYQILLTNKNQNLNSPSNVLGNPDQPALATMKAWNQSNSPKVTPDSTFIFPANGKKYTAPTNQGSNVGFYMVGPVPFPKDPGSTDPKLNPPTPTLLSSGMGYVSNGGAPPLPPTILLQRLACTNLPAQPNPANPYYNPYITVDYMENVPLNNAAAYSGTRGPPRSFSFSALSSVGRLQPYAGHSSLLFKQEPQLIPDPTSKPPIKPSPLDQLPNQPQHTFFQHNATKAPGFVTSPPKVSNASSSGLWNDNPPAGYPNFDWLVHLDRQLVSPVELLNVSAVKPHQLTQQFMSANNGSITRFQHVAPWFDDSLRLYRFFEFVQTHPLVSRGTIMVNDPITGKPTAQPVLTDMNGRVPGRINLNTIWDPEVFQGLCDPRLVGTGPPPNSAAYFDLADVSSMYNTLIANRTPTVDPTTKNRIPGPFDQPFWSLAGSAFSTPPDPQYNTNGSGLKNTFFRAAGAPVPYRPTPTVLRAGVVSPVPRLFQKFLSDPMTGLAVIDPMTGVPTDPDPNASPYLKNQLMTKIFNNVTTRSNTFAVWVTVGLFEVTDDSTSPVKLGAEIGRAQNRQIRHRFFGIVDRTNLAPSPFSTTTQSGIAAGTATMQLGQSTPLPSGQQWVPTVLQVDTGANAEVVTVSAVTLTPPTNTITLTAKFQKNHSQGAPVVSLSPSLPVNPGPWPMFNPHSDKNLIPYFALID